MLTIRNCAVIALILCNSTVVFATDEQTRKIAGWSDDNALIVLVETSGTITDPESEFANKTYFFESHEKVNNGKVSSVHSAGTPEGPIPAKQKPAGKPLKNISKATREWTTSDGAAHIARVTSQEIKPQKKSKSFCELTEMFVLIDNATKRVRPVATFVTKGKLGVASKVKCVRPKTDVAWSKDATTFGIVRQVGKTVNYISQTRADFSDKQIDRVVTTNPLFSTGRLKTSSAWRHVLFGTPIIDTKDEPSVDDAFALLTLSDDKAKSKTIRKQADRLFEKSDKSTWYWGLRAAVYRSTGDTKLTKKYLDKGIAKATSYQDLAELGYLFYEFDLDIAAQLLVHALSHPSAKDEVAHLAYSVLIRTLVGSGNLGAAKQLVEKFETENTGDENLSPNVLLEIARYETQRRLKDAQPHVAKLLLENPAMCDAYALLGRSVAGKNPRHALNLFRAAVTCDPFQREAIFLLADVESRIGSKKALSRFAKYLEISKPRHGDLVRDARTQHASEFVENAAKKQEKKKDKKK